MKVAIDNSPLVSVSSKIRGTGFYIKHLTEALVSYHPEHTFLFFHTGETLTPDIDVFHFPYFEPFFLSLPFKKLGKTVVTIHDLTPLVFPELFPSGIKGKIKFRVQKMLVKRADAVITDSEASKKDIVRILGISPLKVHSVLLAAGSQFVKKNVSKREREKISGKFNLAEKFILYVGDATPNKNLRRLVDAALLFNLPLVMAGGALTKKDIDRSNPWNKDIVYVQEKALQHPNIQLLGYISDEELVALYNLAAVFVFPSLYEGFGLPVLEAAACGCPVVTSSYGSLPEVMGDAAVYADPLNTNDIGEKMKRMFEDRKMQQSYAKKGLLQARKFSWKKTADATVKVYEEVFS